MKLYIPVGCAGCGKSTYYQNNLKDIKRLSMDDIRIKLCGDISDQSRNMDVWKIFSSQITAFAYDNVDLYIDATNLSGIAATIKLASITGNLEQVIIYMFEDSKDPELCYSRICTRENGAKVPKEKILEMSKKYTGIKIPTDSIVNVKYIKS